MKNFHFIFLTLFVATSWAQSEKTFINGKITADVSELDGIYVVNKKTDKVVTTEKGGYFSIPAKIGDTLMFSSLQFIGRSIVLTAGDFEMEIIFVRLESMVHPLDEVKIIKYNNINAVALGIISKDQKSYTPAERHLQTAGDFKPIHLLGLLGGSLQIDPIINAISGRTAMLKKEVAIEKKEILIAKIANMFEDKFFVENLQIPELYVRGFLYYIIENERFLALFKSKNKAMTVFFMGELAVKYNEIVSRE